MSDRTTLLASYVREGADTRAAEYLAAYVQRETEILKQPKATQATTRDALRTEATAFLLQRLDALARETPATATATHRRRILAMAGTADPALVRRIHAATLRAHVPRAVS